MGQASPGRERYKVNGLRLFTVAITRAQSRLYLISVVPTPATWR
jgi:superfamily I DNA/RNA helicase